MTVEFLGRTMAGCEEAILLCLHAKLKSFESMRRCDEVAIGRFRIYDVMAGVPR